MASGGRVTARFEVYVVPRSSAPGPDGRHGGLPRLRVSAPPSGGRANAEAERTLARLLGARARVVGGARARVKTLEIDMEPGELQRRLGIAFDVD